MHLNKFPMLDKQFETACEDSLLIPRNYFARYAVLKGQCNKAEFAWLRLEQELYEQIGAHRFTTLQAFRSAMTRYHDGQVVSSVVLKLT